MSYVGRNRSSSVPSLGTDSSWRSFDSRPRSASICSISLDDSASSMGSSSSAHHDSAIGLSQQSCSLEYRDGDELLSIPNGLSMNSKSAPVPVYGYHAPSQTSYHVLATPEALEDVLRQIKHLPTSPPSIYLDVQGPHLGRHGSISVLSLFLRPLRSVFLVDICRLGQDAFLAADSDGPTLTSILESEDIPKVTFDVRSSSDALYGIYGIRLKCIHEVQLMELITRQRCSKKYLNGMGKCVERDGGLTLQETEAWMKVQQQSRELCNPAFGGNEKALLERPLKMAVLLSCVQNLALLARLWDIYCARQLESDIRKVGAATTYRVKLSQAARYESQGPHMALGPWSPVTSHQRRLAAPLPYTIRQVRIKTRGKTPLVTPPLPVGL